MTPNTSDPWVELQTPNTGQFSRLRVDTNGGSAVFWIRNDENKCGILFEIERVESKKELEKASISISQIEIDIQDIDKTDHLGMVILLKDVSQLDIFSKLCLDLIEQIQGKDPKDSTFLLLCNRLKRWQSL